MSEQPLISIVTPVLNEEENVRKCYEAVRDIADKLKQKYRLEHIFTDNHSTDNTFKILREIALTDDQVRVFRFSRNFGYQRSIHAGFNRAQGVAAIQLDCDLQDPPEMIEDLLRAWEQGNKVVYGIRIKRKEGTLNQFGRWLFYRILSFIGRDSLPEGAGDFRLIDRAILNELKGIRDNRIYLRGRIAELGFKQIGIPYERDSRCAGRSKFNLYRNLALATDAIIAHSALPLRAASYFGLLMTLTSFLAGIGYVFLYFTSKTELPPGFTTLTLLILINLGLTSLFLGFIGEYIGRIYDHLKIPAGVVVESKIENCSLDQP
ncbi:MAG: glycosyltransferase family 2 protein [Bdellovibrionales bacterium]